MSYIPDCRPKYAKDVEKPFANRKETVNDTDINPYWSGLLNDNDKEYLSGFDYNTTNTVNNLFDNLDVYATEFEQIGLDVANIDFTVINGTDPYNDTEDERECKVLDDYSDEDIETMSMETKVCLLMKSILNHYIEMERDELITSMIENMDDSVYEENLKKFNETS